MRVASVPSIALLLLACSSPPANPRNGDSGPLRDAGRETGQPDVDSGAPDSDAGDLDAGIEQLDAGPDAFALESDAGFDAAYSIDAGFDAAYSIDAASRDASFTDASLTDAGSSVDASWGTCTVMGAAGVCLDTAACTGTSTPGYCPGPANIQCCTPSSASVCDPSVLVRPAALVEEPGEAGCPAGMLRIDASYCIDRFEASLIEIMSDGTELPWSPFHNPGSRRARAASVRGAVPQGYINGVQAAAACAEAGKRLCTDQEWLRACQGSTGSTYPYGETRMLGVCNDARARHPAVEYFGTSQSWVFSMLGNACISQLPESLDPTGSNPGCITESGAFDMMGNLHEWTADPAGTFRGGFYVDTIVNGPGCLYRTTAHDTSHWDYSTGFRCCWSG